MPYTQFVEIGRVSLVSFGPNADQPVVIVDIIDDKRVVVDYVNGEKAREVIPVRRLKLTDLVTKIDRGAAPENVSEALNRDHILDKWNNTLWAKRIASRQAKIQMNDFQRFKYAALNARRRELIKAELNKH